MPEQLTSDLGESGAQGKVVAIESTCDHLRTIDALGSMIAETVSEYHFGRLRTA